MLDSWHWGFLVIIFDEKHDYSWLDEKDDYSWLADAVEALFHQWNLGRPLSQPFSKLIDENTFAATLICLGITSLI